MSWASGRLHTLAVKMHKREDGEREKGDEGREILVTQQVGLYE